ncbi:hypothetical protein [Rhizobium laguerreae]|uniref:Uncharacterized protein n=1 Tax=Rhizobium laguerreae TaxID=1076926 RepID=A0AAX2QND8_9HYPH|nr:hypothetical protein [Rhizobium laguerreae]TCU25302.1 hypothetical protein EV131_105416 [Rhizobium laguerreae]
MANFMDRWAAPIAGAVMILILILVISGLEPNRELFCKKDEMCLREWLSALSGWAAAIAAVVTLLTLRQQIRFQIGDVPPSIYAFTSVGPDRRPQVTFILENWNRRPLHMQEVKITRASQLIILYPKTVEIDGTVTDVSWNRYLPGYVTAFLPGRVDGHKTSSALVVCDVMVAGPPDEVQGELAIYRCGIEVKSVQMDRAGNDTTTATDLFLTLNWPIRDENKWHTF